MAQNEFEKVVSQQFKNPDTQVKAAQAFAFLKEAGATNDQVLAIGVMMSQTAKEVIRQDLQKLHEKGQKKK